MFGTAAMDNWWGSVGGVYKGETNVFGGGRENNIFCIYPYLSAI